MGPNGNILISIDGLKVHYRTGGGLFRASKLVKAVDGVSLDIKKGETLGLVGESGCGKSTLGRAILRLTEPTGGKVLYNGKDLAHLPKTAMREQRKHLQMIFQDPYASLNPRMTVGSIIGEPLRTFGIARGRAALAQVEELMETVGLSRRFIKRYPHEFSGGQRQRIGIARALAVDPEFIVADEPISALDVSIQAQIMNLMERLQAEKNLTYLFISHDLRAVRHLSDRVAVMYLGKIVELADGKEVYRDPLMPYTRRSSRPFPFPTRRSRQNGRASFSRAMSRRRSIRRPAAISAPAARTPSRSAKTSRRRSSRSSRATSPPASAFRPSIPTSRPTPPTAAALLFL